MKDSRPAGRLRRAILAGAAVIATALLPFVSPQAPAQAANITDGFNPGNIISDSLFYDGNAMTAAQVQTFLNSKVSRCTIGDTGKKAGSRTSSGNIVAANCLKDFKMTTQTRAADRYCSGYVGKANETAAQIIQKVGKACSISQKVLLVMLEKEQSLVSDSWPVTRMYNYAMGMNCPDSGPNNSANCNADSAGFFLQLYLGARQLQVYKLNQNTFGYKPFVSNRIQWHPNAGCGTSQVTIQNYATAALYIYTPYRPNTAALNAGWGTGDSCSSYGNRNFYNFYKSWFGDTQGGPNFAITGAMLTYWNANRGWLGQPTGTAVSVSANGGGKLQYFVGGFVYQSNKGKPAGFTKSSPIVAAFGKAGGIEGKWGWPLSPAVSYGSGNSVVRFQGGAVVEAKGTGVYLVPEANRVAWQNSGGFNGSLGYPTGNSASIGSAGNTQKFKKGTLYASSSGKFALPNGRIATGYSNANGVKGSWGWPRGRQLCTTDGFSCTMEFTKGVATWTSTRGVIFTPLNVPNTSKPASPSSGEKVLGGAAQ